MTEKLKNTQTLITKDVLTKKEVRKIKDCLFRHYFREYDSDFLKVINQRALFNILYRQNLSKATLDKLVNDCDEAQIQKLNS